MAINKNNLLSRSMNAFNVRKVYIVSESDQEKNKNFTFYL